jgi:formamidopyrimidine-DNA glycosylase
MPVPELPEVETVVRTLRPMLVGERIRGVWWSGMPLRMVKAPDLAALERVCAGGRVSAVRRRAKYILVDVSDGRGRPRGGVVVHLGMSGRLGIAAASVERAKHTHVVFVLGDGRELRFTDPRRFGWVGAAAVLDDLPELSALGPDPLTELDTQGLAAALATSSTPVKAFLLDQKRVAGLGNIYVCEALFRAGVHPTTPARRVKARAAALMKGIREALELGIANRGTTLRDYVDAWGAEGNNASSLLVYGREGEACKVCGSAIVRRVDAGRSTFFCARCQRR